MSTTPPEGPGAGRRDEPRTQAFASPGSIATLPIPGNAELVVYVLFLIVLGIIALASNRVDAPEFCRLAAFVTAAYLISRGIAKASRVLER
jgi:hypothetical protein